MYGSMIVHAAAEDHTTKMNSGMKGNGWLIEPFHHSREHVPAHAFNDAALEGIE
jgi:hypothetical protein